MKASASSGRTPAFCGSPPVLTSTNRRGRLPARVDLARERGGDFLAVDGFDDVEGLDRLARLVALQWPDQMKLDRLAERGGAGAQIPPLGDRLLHPVLAEAGLAGDRDRRPDLVGGKGLGYGDELDRFRRPAAVARPPRDRLPQRDEASSTAPRASSGCARIRQISLHDNARLRARSACHRLWTRKKREFNERCATAPARGLRPRNVMSSCERPCLLPSPRA